MYLGVLPPCLCGVVPHVASILSQMTAPGLAIATCSGPAPVRHYVSQN